MSDAYGMITFAKSSDCDIDANAMLISLKPITKLFLKNI